MVASEVRPTSLATRTTKKTFIKCNSGDFVPIFKDACSATQIGVAKHGDVFMTAGTITSVAGWAMLNLADGGAVQADFFDHVPCCELWASSSHSPPSVSPPPAATPRGRHLFKRVLSEWRSDKAMSFVDESTQLENESTLHLIALLCGGGKKPGAQSMRAPPPPFDASSTPPYQCFFPDCSATRATCERLMDHIASSHPGVGLANFEGTWFADQVRKEKRERKHARSLKAPEAVAADAPNAPAAGAADPPAAAEPRGVGGNWECRKCASEWGPGIGFCEFCDKPEMVYVPPGESLHEVSGRQEPFPMPTLNEASAPPYRCWFEGCPYESNTNCWNLMRHVEKTHGAHWSAFADTAFYARCQTNFKTNK